MNNRTHKTITKNNNTYIFNLLVIVVLENLIINKLIIIHSKGAAISDNLAAIV